MQILMCGLDHKTVPLPLRERFAFSDATLDEGLAALAARPDVLEVAILSTCNRTEIYAVVTSEPLGRAALRAFALESGRLSAAEFDAHACFRSETQAVKHLFRLAAGLESLVLGEGQILAQMKDALAAARRHRTVGALLDPVFRFALVAGKRVRSETTIAHGAVSVVGAALELVRERLGALEGRQALVLGAGKMGELAAKQLVAKGMAWTYVASRTLETATLLAEAAGAQALPFHNLQTALATVDVVVCCTDAPHHVLAAADFAPVAAVRQGRPLLLVDLAVPRNLDPHLAGYAGVSVVDMDDLEAVAARHRLEREEIVVAAETALEQELASYEAWRLSVPLNPAIASLCSKFTSVREQELERFMSRHAAHFTPEQQALVDGLTRSMVNKFLHEPLTQLKESASAQRPHIIRALELLYDLKIEGFSEYYRKRLEERRQAPATLVSVIS